jgi:Tol biopolymer transport system component/aminoglycoside phosphotransferase (APT) family kinase protein
MIGNTISSFRIVGELGAGGMGEVWRAEDTKLGREVAIKLLPQEVAGDAERLARFQREAKMLASLNHPHIAILHGLETAGLSRTEAEKGNDETTFLVMELVEGETLAERISRGPISIEEAMEIARQIAEALEAAHDAGIVHRDLKPANVKITPSGQVKVLDFGLAKAYEPTADEVALTHSPTLTAHMTAAGVVLGTAAYMSPEQARGIEVDKRADIWAFGCVLYEMLAGEQAFRGDTVSDVMASILKEEPDAEALPTNTPPRLRRVLGRCLAKQPRQRFHDIADARIEIEEIAAGEDGGYEVSQPSTPSGGIRFWRAAAAVLLLTALVTAAFALRRAPRQEKVLRAFIPPPTDTSFSLEPARPGAVAVSPNGQQLAFSARDAGGEVLLWVRRIGDLEARSLSGTEGAAYPFWSSDSRHLAFFTDDGKLRKIDTTGGPPVTICAAANGKGGSWGSDGHILFAPAHNTPIHIVSAAGGESSPITEVPEGVVGHRFPQWIDDSRFLFLARSSGGAEEDRIMVASTGEPSAGDPVIAASSNVVIASDRLLFVRERTLLAQPFDSKSAAVSGDAVPIAEDVLYLGGARLGVFSASQDGLLAYQTGDVQRETELVWLDRQGQVVGQLGAGVLHRGIVLANDGEYAAAEVLDEATGASDVWIYDVSRGLRTRFTFDPNMDWFPVWSPDGRRIAFASNRNGTNDIWAKDVGGASNEEPLLEDPDNDVGPMSWSRDGRWIVIIRVDSDNNSDIWALPTDGGDPVALAASSFDESTPSLSPDGRWLAYASDESGKSEVYVTTFPNPARRWQVSTEGGELPQWRADGRELFFIRPDGTLAAAEVNGTGDTFSVGEVGALFSWTQTPAYGWPYGVTGDGQRFLVNRSLSSTESAPLTLALNWDADLELR